MDYALIPTTPEHIEHVADNMRQADVLEVLASAGVGPKEALRLSAMLSEPCLTGTADGEPFCIFGVVPRSMMSSSGVPWLLGTPGVERHAKAFLKHSRWVVEEWSKRFDLLENWVDSRNTKSIAWLRWLGFTIHDPEPHGPFGMPFCKFEMRRG